MTVTAKRTCPWCERKITCRSGWTGTLHAHKWTQEQHVAAFPGLPFLDAWCPGGRAGAR